MLRSQISGISPLPPKRAGHKGPRVVPTNLQRQELRKWWNDDSHGHREALRALHILCRYEEENAYGNVELLKLLQKQDREINARLQELHKQARLDRWFIKEN